jgi:hypothetical protein
MLSAGEKMVLSLGKMVLANEKMLISAERCF